MVPPFAAAHAQTVGPCTGTRRHLVSTLILGSHTPPHPTSSSPILTHSISWTIGSSRDTHCGTCLPGFYEYDKSCVSCPT